MQFSHRPGGASLASHDDAAAAPSPGRTTLVQLKREVGGGGEIEGPAGGAPAAAEPDGPGAPLPAQVRTKMEASLGADFSTVRIHEGPQAAKFNALAYARGESIFFQPGKYDPTSAAGQELLGHELAHVVQQRAGKVDRPQGKGGVNADAGLEAEADAHGAKAARGERVEGASSGGVAAADGAAQLRRELTLAQVGQLQPGGNGGWRIVVAPEPHITVFLDDDSANRLRDLRERRIVQVNGTTNRIRPETLPQDFHLYYDELHVTNRNTNQHFYYSDAGAPQAASNATGARSPNFTDPGWHAANGRVANFLGLDRWALNLLVNNLGGHLATTQEELNQQQPPPRVQAPVNPLAMVPPHLRRLMEARGQAIAPLGRGGAMRRPPGRPLPTQTEQPEEPKAEEKNEKKRGLYDDLDIEILDEHESAKKKLDQTRRDDRDPGGGGGGGNDLVGGGVNNLVEVGN